MLIAQRPQETIQPADEAVASRKRARNIGHHWGGQRGKEGDCGILGKLIWDMVIAPIVFVYNFYIISLNRDIK